MMVALLGLEICLLHFDRLKNVVGMRYKTVNLCGKVFIVTGSNTGIGTYISVVMCSLCITELA